MKRFFSVTYSNSILLSCALFSTPIYASQLHYEARSAAMGGISTAQASRISAVFSNPALLGVTTHHSDDVSVLLPVIGMGAADPDQIIDKIDGLQTNYDALNIAISNQNQNDINLYRDELVADLEGLKGNSADIDLGIGLSVVLPEFESGLNLGIFYKSYADLKVISDIAQTDINTISAIDPSNPGTIPPLDNLQSEGIVLGGGVSDLGIAISYPISFMELPINLGITPKIQRLDTYQYSVNLNSFDTDDVTDEKYRTEKSTFNIDLGLTIEPIEDLLISVSGQNLISQELETTDIYNWKVKYQLEPLVTAGVSYNLALLTLATELDLTTQTPFENQESYQYWRVGGEVNLYEWIALRFGYQTDLESNQEDLLTAGLGLKLFNSFAIDVAGKVGDNDAYSAAVQTSFYF